MRGLHRRFGIWAGTVLTVMVSGAYTVYALVPPLPIVQPTASFSFNRIASATTIDWPDFGEAAVGAAGFGVLATHGQQKALPTASVIKILTALAVLQQHPLAPGADGPTITLNSADVASYNKYVAMDGSVVRVVDGEQLTERQALEALLLPSANNIAETLARWAFGSIPSYNAFANQYATRLGMADTTVTDPSGFLPTTVSTPRDLVILGEAAMSDPVIPAIVAAKSAVIPVQGTIRNVNVLLGQDGIIGIKTGNNDQDPGCFLFAAKQPVGGNSVTIIGVVMEGPTLGEALWGALPIIRSMAKNFSEVAVVRAGSTVGQYNVPWQPSIRAITGKDLVVVTWNGSAISSHLYMESLSVPTGTSPAVGTLTVTADKQYSIPVALKTPLKAPTIIWRLLHAF